MLQERIEKSKRTARSTDVKSDLEKFQDELQSLASVLTKDMQCPKDDEGELIFILQALNLYKYNKIFANLTVVKYCYCETVRRCW